MYFWNYKQQVDNFTSVLNVNQTFSVNNFNRHCATHYARVLQRWNQSGQLIRSAEVCLKLDSVVLNDTDVRCTVYSFQEPTEHFPTKHPRDISRT